MSISPGCFQRCFPFPQLGLFPKQLVDPSLHGLQLQLDRVLAVLAAPALALLTGYKLIADSGNQNKTCDNKAL